MTQPKVSIIISNYNYGRFVGEAIDSALCQTYPHVEVIVVDDGSTDESRQVIESRGSKVWAIFQGNRGQASAMNVGFRASTGDLLLFLDSDDVLSAEAADVAVGAWQDGTFQTQFPLELIDDKGNSLGRVVGTSIAPSPTLGPFTMTSGNMFSREVLDKVMPIPEEDFQRYPDAYLRVTTAIFGGVTLIQKPLGKYRIHGDNKHLGDTGPAQARRAVRCDLRLFDALARLAPGRMPTLADWLARCPQHWVNRITSLRESPSDHPWPDTVSQLLTRAIRATWRHPYWNLRRKLAYTVFVVGYGLSPGTVRRTLKKAEGSARAAVPKLLLGKPPLNPEG